MISKANGHHTYIRLQTIERSSTDRDTHLPFPPYGTLSGLSLHVSVTHSCSKHHHAVILLVQSSSFLPVILTFRSSHLDDQLPLLATKRPIIHSSLATPKSTRVHPKRGSTNYLNSVSRAHEAKFQIQGPMQF
jgi:hypothetical protein